MSFIQIIDIRTDKIDEIMALDKDWEAATEGKRTLRRSIVARDRNDSGRHLVLAFFDSYESAMVNSNLAETQAFARSMESLVDSMAFLDLDVVDDRS